MQAAGSEAERAFTLLLGPRTARPHSAPAHYRMKPGDVAFTELGGRCQDYFAGLCRTAVLGRNPAAEALYDVAREAQEAALAVIRPGLTIGDIDRACRSVVQRAGRGDTFRHRTGYSIGLGWQSRGNISIHPGGTHLVEAGMTFHMPTILFQQGEFGVGVSETVVVTPHGCEPLSGLSRELARV
jgi:Xaa-Pro dipeptidase